MARFFRLPESVVHSTPHTAPSAPILNIARRSNELASLNNTGNKWRPGISSRPLVHFIRLIGYLHESLTIFTCVTVRCPCSSLVFVAPLSFAASFASSFMLCAVALDTTPVAVTV